MSGDAHPGLPPGIPPCDPRLPIAAHAEEITRALAAHQTLIVCGATGSGKSTQLPRLCLAAGRGSGGLIGHTQPRRLAARAIATRLASELGTRPGTLVGWQVRFDERIGPGCRVKVMTDGILLRELEADRELRRYDTLIIDEAHERTLNIDLLLGMLRGLQQRRPELRVLVTSATIDPGRLSRYFGDAPVIEVSGSSYPVEVRWRPPAEELESGLPRAVAAALRELDGHARAAEDAEPAAAAPPLPAPAAPRGDVLVFLPGEQHIREVAAELERAADPGSAVLPLYARLSLEAQSRIFDPHGERRIVLATNVAETSLTVPGIRHVIDSGLARIARYSARDKVERLPIEPVSRASAEQRRGRCGREAPGICIRLYAEEDFAARPEFTEPEVLRSNLASVLLRMASVGLGDPAEFPFIDPPDHRLLREGLRLLRELQALDAAGEITPLGRRIAALPLDPRLGRMLLAAGQHGCVAEMLVITAFLEAQDPRERPPDRQREAAARHAAFADGRSDFVSILNLWRACAERSAESGSRAMRRWCEANFLSWRRVREWQALHEQLARVLRELGITPRPGAARHGALHRALLTGFLGSVGRRMEGRQYLGTRGLRFQLAPGTPVAARPPGWIVAASLVETRRVYARMVAAVQPAWIEQAAAHLLERDYSAPEWVPARGVVGATETVRLQGLTLSAHRRVNYGRTHPREAREIFIREALLADDPGGSAGLPQAGFLAANRALRRELESLEARVRRRDIVVAESEQVAFYAARLPEQVNSVANFRRWLAELAPAAQSALHMARSDLTRHDAPTVDSYDHPDALAFEGQSLPLEYRFDPEDPADGITLVVPEPLLPRLDPDRLAWLVPGLRLPKLEALLRGLPRPLRRQLVPVPAHARAALEAWQAAGGTAGLHAFLAGWITARTGTSVTAAELEERSLPPHLRLNVRVLDAHGTVLAEGRDLAALRRRLYRAAPAAGVTPPPPETSAVVELVHRRWDFGDLPERTSVTRAGLTYFVYPALQMRPGGVVLVEARSREAAEASSRPALGLLALLQALATGTAIRRGAASDRDLVLLSRGLELAPELPDALALRAAIDCVVPEEQALPRTQGAFAARLSRMARIEQRAAELQVQLRGLLATRRELLARCRELEGRSDGAASASRDAGRDVTAQLDALFRPDFIITMPRARLARLPVWLEAARRRLARLPADAQRDARLERQLQPHLRALQALASEPAAALADAQIRDFASMIEEYRVSLWAQELRAAVPVSDRRLGEQLARTRAALHLG